MGFEKRGKGGIMGAKGSGKIIIGACKKVHSP
jgi:hypothetical protein